MESILRMTVLDDEFVESIVANLKNGKGPEKFIDVNNPKRIQLDIRHTHHVYVLL